MADNKNKKTYISMERGKDSLKYIAKLFDEPPREITKQQYNAIVKALGEQDWRNNVEDESVVINAIINSVLKQPDNDS